MDQVGLCEGLSGIIFIDFTDVGRSSLEVLINTPCIGVLDCIRMERVNLGTALDCGYDGSPQFPAALTFLKGWIYQGKHDFGRSCLSPIPSVLLKTTRLHSESEYPYSLIWPLPPLPQTDYQGLAIKY